MTAELDLVRLLQGSLEAHPARVALREEGRAVTYAELGREVASLAGWFQSKGLSVGDRVCVHLSKSIEEVVAMFAAAWVGAAFVNVNSQWTPRQLAMVLEDCRPRLLVTDARRLRALLQLEVALPPAVLVPGESGDLPADSWPHAASGWQAEAREVGPDALAAVLYTSGSTGGPKGVMLSHRNLTLGALSVSTYLQNVAEDRVLGLLPFSFDYGLSQLTTQFLVGGSVSLLGTMMPAEIVRVLREHRITGLPALPAIWTPLVRYLVGNPVSLPDLRYLTNTGGKIPDPILELLPQVFGGASIFLMYGLTEGFRATYLHPEKYASKRGSIGQAIPHVEVFVVHPERGLCAPGEEGELIQGGPLLFQGYWGRPEETRRVLKPCPHLAARIGDEAVLHSGDFVRMDEDGDLWFVGRGDGLIKSSGFRVSPEEVEELVLASGLVLEVVAFGCTGTDHESRVAVAIVPSERWDPAQFRRYCRKDLPGYMRPAQVHLWPGELPRTPHGKFDRRQIARGPSDPVSEGS